MPPQKHILFISSWYPNRNNPTHGIFNQYFVQAASLYNKVSVINISSKASLSKLLELNESSENNIVTVNAYYKKWRLKIPLFSNLIKRQRVISASTAAYELLFGNSGKPDLIQLNVVMPMGIAVLHLSKKYNIPFVISENWSGYCAEDGNYKGFLQQFFTRKIVESAKVIMPTSKYLQDAMQRHKLSGNYQIVPNVVNTHLFNATETQKKSSTRFIHISSLNDREKNVSGIIRAFQNALKTNSKLELVIVGEGIDKEKYESLVQELNLSAHISFTGRLMSENLVKEINESDALLMFSNYETFCLVIIEAFACGKPVITSSAGAIKSYMQPSLGLMVDVGNEEELGAAILQFDTSKADFDSKSIRQFALDNYSYERVGKTLDSIYQSVVSSYVLN